MGPLKISDDEKKFILEAYGLISEGTVKGRKVTVNSDGTVSIPNKKNIIQKIRMYTKLAEINVAKITPAGNGYNITGKSGRTEFVDDEKINKFIEFVDTNKPNVINSGSMTKPNIYLKKV